jgi:Flp pilus assembly protein TadD
MNLGRAYIRRGTSQAALRGLEAAARLAPADRGARKMLHEIRAWFN